MTCDGIHRHHGATKERLGIEQRVVGCHRRFIVTIVTEKLHLHGSAEVAHDFVLVHALFLEHTVSLAALDGIVDERLLPRRTELCAVVGIGVLGTTALAQECGLERLAHVLLDCLLGISLHTLVNGGVDFEAVAVDVIVRPIRLGVLLAPAVERVDFPCGGVVDIGLAVPRGVVVGVGFLGGHHASQLFTEVRCQTIVVVHLVITEHKGCLLDRVAVGLADVSFLSHLVKHHVSALACALGMAQGVKIAWVLAHAHQCSRLLQV